jgi:hypothetical protein
MKKVNLTKRHCLFISQILDAQQVVGSIKDFRMISSTIDSLKQYVPTEVPQPQLKADATDEEKATFQKAMQEWIAEQERKFDEPVEVDMEDMRFDLVKARLSGFTQYNSAIKKHIIAMADAFGIE